MHRSNLKHILTDMKLNHIEIPQTAMKCIANFRKAHLT